MRLNMNRKFRKKTSRFLLTPRFFFIAYLLALGACKSNEDALDQAKANLAAGMSDHELLIEIFPELPDKSSLLNIDELLGVEQSSTDGTFIALSAVEKFEIFIRTRELNVEGGVLLQAYEYEQGGERVYKRVTLDSCGSDCIFNPDSVTQIDSTDYLSAIPSKGESTLKEVKIGGDTFFLKYAYRSNRRNELVVIEASVLTLPENFLQRWGRQLEQSQPPYFRSHPVYQEYVPVGLVTMVSAR